MQDKNDKVFSINQIIILQKLFEENYMDYEQNKIHVLLDLKLEQII